MPTVEEIEARIIENRIIKNRVAKLQSPQKPDSFATTPEPSTTLQRSIKSKAATPEIFKNALMELATLHKVFDPVFSPMNERIRASAQSPEMLKALLQRYLPILTRSAEAVAGTSEEKMMAPVKLGQHISRMAQESPIQTAFDVLGATVGVGLGLRGKPTITPKVKLAPSVTETTKVGAIKGKPGDLIAKLKPKPKIKAMKSAKIREILKGKREIKPVEVERAPERIPHSEAIKSPDRPEMKSMTDYYKTIMAPKELRPPIKKAALSETTQKAQILGIALRQTKGGKVVPAVRKAGTFVPEDFANYKNFKDAKQGIGGGSKDWIRYVQEVDGALSLQKKAKLPGQSGPAEKYILRRQEDIVKLELDWSAEQSLRIQEIIKDLSRKQEKAVTRVLEQTSRPGSYVKTADFATSSRIKLITTDKKVVKAAQESRKALEHWFKQQNDLRGMRGQELIEYRKYYAPHILREASLWERAFGSKVKPKDVISRPQLPDYIKPNKPFNPRELAREIGMEDFIREMRIGKILENYANTASRDIHHTSIIQNNKAFIQQLETMGYKNAAEGIGNFTAESFGGVKARLDRAFDFPIRVSRGMRFWRGSLMRSIFPLNFAWNTTVQTLSSGLTVMRTGITSSTRGMVDWFANPQLRNQIKSAYSYQVKAQRAGKITHQDINTGLTKMISGKRSTWQTAIDGTNYLTELVERELTGWSIASGLRHGAKKGLKGKALWDYASDTGAKTQSMYNMENKPGILRSEAVQTATPLQTFVFEMYNTTKELAGKTGTPPATMAERAGWVLRFTAAAYAGNEMAHALTGRRPWDIYSFIPFSDQTIKPVVDALRGKSYEAVGGRGQISFVGAGIQFAIAVRSYLKTGDNRKLRNWGLKYGTAFMKIPGGTQISRMVDGWIAVADGGMKDTRGRTLFRISDPWEQTRAITLGPWRTKAGIEYWDERKTNILQDIGIMKKESKKRFSGAGIRR